MAFRKDQLYKLVNQRFYLKIPFLLKFVKFVDSSLIFHENTIALFDDVATRRYNVRLHSQMIDNS